NVDFETLKKLFFIMSETVPPILPPIRTSTGNLSSLNVNRVDTMPTNETINTTTTTNVVRNVDEYLPQLLDSRGGSHVSNIHTFDREDFLSWKISIIISYLPNDVMKSVIKYKSAKEMCNELVLTYEGPSDTRDTKIDALRLKFNAFKALAGEKVNGTYTQLKCLLNDLKNNSVVISQVEVNATFVNSLPRKWLSMNQTQRANNSIKNDCLAARYGKYHYEEDVKEDNRTNNEFMADLNTEYQERALLENQKRFYKRIDDLTKGKSEKGKSDKGKSEKGYITESFDWDDESVSSEDEYTTKFKAFMEIAEDEPFVGKIDARSGQWVEITMKKVHRLLSMTDGKERKHVLDYTHVDLHYVEDQRKYLVKNFNALKQDPLLHKSELFKALGRKGRRKENNPSKVVVFIMGDESSSEQAPEVTSDSEADCDTHEPLPTLPKLIGVEPTVLETYVIKKTESKLPDVQISCSDKKTNSSTEQLLLTLMEEVKGIKDHIKIPSVTSPSGSQASSSKPSKQKVWYGPCIH
ncbi:hypothetical protein Tco_1243845, partial [Tanacetum coccineum]